jgi:hypothetical protein
MPGDPKSVARLGKPAEYKAINEYADYLKDIASEQALLCWDPCELNPSKMHDGVSQKPKTAKYQEGKPIEVSGEDPDFLLAIGKITPEEAKKMKEKAEVACRTVSKEEVEEETMTEAEKDAEERFGDI